MSVTIFHANLIKIQQKCYRQTKAEYFKDASEEEKTYLCPDRVEGYR